MSYRWEPCTLKLTADQVCVLWDLVHARVEVDHDSTKKGALRGHHSAEYATLCEILRKLEQSNEAKG